MTFDRSNPDPSQPLTPSRRAWLELLEQNGEAGRPRGVTGISCMRAGWTQWVWERPDGARVGTEAVYETFGSEPGAWARADQAGWRHTTMETLTPAGREKLREDRAA